MALKVKIINPDASLPKRGSDLAAGYDLYAVESSVIHPGRRGVIPTGIAIQVPPGTYGRIAPRSGLAVKSGIQVGAGVIDRDYTGEIKVVLFNHDTNNFVIRPGYRIAQLILERCDNPPVEQVDNLNDTGRGDTGFGSTGIADHIHV